MESREKKAKQSVFKRSHYGWAVWRLLYIPGSVVGVVLYIPGIALPHHLVPQILAL